MTESLDSLASVSGAMRDHAINESASIDQATASANDAANQQALALYNKYLQEVDAGDPSSTVGAPNAPSFKPVFVSGPPKTILVFPEETSKKPACYSESWWTRHLAPPPVRESDLSSMVAKKTPSPGLSQKDIKLPPAVKNFPIQFDRFMNYKEFLS